MNKLRKNTSKKGRTASLRCDALVSLRAAIRDQVKRMRECAKCARSGKGYAHPEMQPLRDASAHAEEFWAKILEETLEANNSSQRTRPPVSENPPAEANTTDGRPGSL